MPRLLERSIAALLVTVIAVLVFWSTAYPTITWWNSAEYSLAAGTLGVVGPPGSLLLTLLGWPFAHLPFGSSPAHVLNLLAGALAAVTAGLVCVLALRLSRFTRRADADHDWSRPAALGAALGALTFAFSSTLWEYAVQFTPYILAALFTALILLVMLRWWEEAGNRDAWRWLALLGLLFGLDFSVHRSNALLMAGVLAWILVRRPRTLLAPRNLLVGAVGLVAGLAVQLLIIPIATGAMTRSPLFFNAPTDWSRFWDYVSLKRLGGDFLVQVFPRKAGFWSVQVADLLRVLGANFLHGTGPAGVLYMLAAAAALLGLVTLWRRDRRLGVAYALVLLLQASMTVLFYNIPANFFRTFDRHYLPACLTIAVLAAYGLAVALEAAARLSVKQMPVAAGAIGLLAVMTPLSHVIGNWSLRDASGRYFTKDFSTNLLTSLPRDAILFTVGDNDTFPLLYFQAVEGVRRDVTIINLSEANEPAFPKELLRREPSFPLTRSPAGPMPKTITIPVTGTAQSLGLPPDVKPPPAITVTVKPRYGTQFAPADVLVLDMVRTNAWHRPVCFSVTGSPQAMGGLAPYGRLEGLYWRVVPTIAPPADIAQLRANLLERADYRGYALPAVRMDNDDRALGSLPYLALAELLDAERKSGDTEQCRADRAALFAAVPPDRLELPVAYREEIAAKCGPAR